MVQGLRAHARLMRWEATPAERRLWQALRLKQVDGRKWRRPVPMGCYIEDVFCPQLRLVVEVDGATHVDSAGDGAREAWLRGQGYGVIRFWKNEVLGNLAGVLQVIGGYSCVDAGRSDPSPNPLPQGEGAL